MLEKVMWNFSFRSEHCMENNAYQLIEISFKTKEIEISSTHKINK